MRGVNLLEELTMWNFYIESEPVARKEYACDASIELLAFGFDQRDFAPEDWNTIKQAEKEGCKILPGKPYRKVKGKFEGAFHVFRARKDMDAICIKYNLYEENGF